MHTLATNMPSPATEAGFPPAPPSPSPVELLFMMDGRAYDRGQLIAALRCSEELYSAYSRAQPAAGRSVSWDSVDAAHEHARDALSATHRASIDSDFVAEFYGVAPEGAGIMITTEGEAPDLDVIGASIEAEHLHLLLLARPVLRVRNQDDLVLDLSLDMDQETLIAALP